MKYTVFGCQHDTLIEKGFSDIWSAISFAKRTSVKGYKARVYDNTIGRFIKWKGL